MAKRRTWRVSGTRRGERVTVDVEATDCNEATKLGSHAPHMLVIDEVVLLTSGHTETFFGLTIPAEQADV